MSGGITLKRRFPLLEERKNSIENVITYLKENKSSVRSVLTEISTYRTADDEINTSISVLENAFDEVQQNKPATVNKMSVFMPSNLILYSYVLYLLIPSLYVDTIEFRSSRTVICQMNRLHKILKDVHQLPIHLLDLSYRKYLKTSTLDANIVAFTGEYKNAEKIKPQLSQDQLYVYFGQGVNPFVVTKTANIKKTVNDLIQARLYNTGQDCMGPDAVFVHESISQKFREILINKLQSLKYGSNSDPAADYGRMYYTSTLNLIGNYLNENSEFVFFGGRIDYRNKVIEPTVMYSSIEENIKIDEFFSPLFNIISYRKIDQLKSIFENGYFLERAMGASIYGKYVQEIIDFLSKRHIVSINQTLYDIEDGNKPFGGHGPMANYVSYMNQLHIKPILLSKIVNELMVNNGE